MNRGVYKNLVRVFYSNATNKFQDFVDESEIANSDRFTTYALGKQIVVVPYFLGIVLGLPTHGRDCTEENLTELELDNEAYRFPPILIVLSTVLLVCPSMIGFCTSLCLTPCQQGVVTTLPLIKKICGSSATLNMEIESI